MGTEEKSQFPSPDQSRNSLSAEKRKRKFQPSWQAQYDWLEYNEEEGMFCANCRKYPHLAGKKTLRFFIGSTKACKTFRLKPIHALHKSKLHEACTS